MITLGGASLDCDASDVFVYRVVPIASAPHATPSNAHTGLLSFPPWPARYDWGTALRARFPSYSYAHRDWSGMMPSDFAPELGRSNEPQKSFEVLSQNSVRSDWPSVPRPKRATQ